MIPTAKLAQKRAKLRAKLDGTMISMAWVEWPDGKPTSDPTTGSTIETDATQPVNKTADVRAFIHFVAPVQSGYRKFAEVETGNAIVDFPLDLMRVTDAGDTDFEVDEVMDEITFSRANRDLTEEQDSAIATIVDPTSLESLSMTFGGHTWVQKEVGEELAQNWDTLYSGLNINRAMLMRKSGGQSSVTETTTRANRIFSGSTSPEGVQTGIPGDEYNQIVDGVFVTSWIKSTGVNTNTGWT